MNVELVWVNGKQVISIDGEVPSVQCLFNTLKFLTRYYTEAADDDISNEEL